MEHQTGGQFFVSSHRTARRPSLLALLLAAIPFVAICFSVGLWDRVYPMLAGVPFNIFWLILWTLLTPLCMWGAYHFEQRKKDEYQRVRNEDRP